MATLTDSLNKKAYLICINSRPYSVYTSIKRARSILKYNGWRKSKGSGGLYVKTKLLPFSYAEIKVIYDDIGRLE